MRIWDFYSCYEEKVLRGHGADVKCVDWHPHKGIVVSGSKDNQQPIKIWDPKAGIPLATMCVPIGSSIFLVVKIHRIF